MSGQHLVEWGVTSELDGCLQGASHLHSRPISAIPQDKALNIFRRTTLSQPLHQRSIHQHTLPQELVGELERYRAIPVGKNVVHRRLDLIPLGQRQRRVGRRAGFDFHRLLDGMKRWSGEFGHADWCVSAARLTMSMRMAMAKLIFQLSLTNCKQRPESSVSCHRPVIPPSCSPSAHRLSHLSSSWSRWRIAMRWTVLLRSLDVLKGREKTFQDPEEGRDLLLK
jgi:hypothetical protein